jgi:Cache 3/Cache 2 fusion domain
MTRNIILVVVLVAGCFMSMLVPNAGNAQLDPTVEKAMAALKAATGKLGAPKLDGKEPVGGKDASALYFGSTKVNNNFDVVDAVTKEYSGTATLFAKTGDEFVRVSTNVPMPDGSGRAIGTVLAGPALEAIKGDKAFYGEVPILDVPYMTGYEPIKDGSGAIVGAWYVGYKK